jgi:hypothetical protein
MQKRRTKRHSVTQPSDPSYRFIPLTQGQNAIVDVADFEFLNQWKWFASFQRYTKSFYALRRSKKVEGHKTISMHRVILGCGINEQVDHKNHDTLDNRRENLRKCTHSQNSCNRRTRSDNSSGIPGVTLVRGTKWRVRVGRNGHRTHLGYFNSAEEAAKVREAAAKEIHGEFVMRE